ncbi:hypothetical protein C0995_009111 [Termitomyces sp. Mi166|nr:hypothetical protein C0995_009111 [Termitomyces sp. Mi166\
MSRYDFDITYVKGELNKVADCLLRYFESDTADDMHNVYDYVQADKRIDPEGEDLPLHRFHEIAEKRVEIQAMQAQELRRSKQLKEQKELRDLCAQQMVEATKTPNKGIELSSHNNNPLLAQVLKKRTESSITDDDPAVVQVLAMGTKAPINSEHGEVQMCAHILQGYKKDRMYVEILNKPTEHSQFTIEQKLIYTVNMEGVKVLCVPRDWSLITTILDQAHTIVGHFGYQKTLNYDMQNMSMFKKFEQETSREATFASSTTETLGLNRNGLCGPIP